MPKNLVICCDGTNNSTRRHPTNVAVFHRLAVGLDNQHAYYDEGVGVEGDPNALTLIGRTLSRWTGLAFGTGLIANVRQAYLELVDHYEPGDHIYLFGFSRGAYTVRVIVGLLQHFALLKPEYRDQADQVLAAYRRLFDSKQVDVSTAAQARRRLFEESAEIRAKRAVPCPIHFMGVFDTVSSLGWLYDPKTFANTATMPNVATIRHALAVDERRAKFRTNRVAPVDNQDVREVWFAGVHSDVGGGYPPNEAQLSRVPLRWMLGQAKLAGLRVNPTLERALGLEATAATDEQAPQHESLQWFWQPLEHLALPHRIKRNGQWVEERTAYRGEGWRALQPGDLASESLRRRQQPVKNTNWASVVETLRWEP